VEHTIHQLNNLQKTYILKLMKLPKLTLGLLSLIGMAVSASAHVSYTGRDFGTYSGTDLTTTISNQNVTSDYGWADATDADLGDTHKTRAFRFRLTTNAWVTLTFSGLAYTGVATNRTTGIVTTINYTPLALPAFSVYSGLAAASTHDGASNSVAWRNFNYGTGATEGSLNALGDWKIGVDGQTNFSQLSSLTYVGNAASGTTANYGTPASSLTLADGRVVPNAAINGSGNSNGTVTGSFYLGAGDYSVFVGGANYYGTATNTPYGIQGTFTAVPEPSTWALFGLGAFMLTAAVLRHRTRA
jgi:hypothetical protein